MGFRGIEWVERGKGIGRITDRRLMLLSLYKGIVFCCIYIFWKQRSIALEKSIVINLARNKL